MTTARDHTPEEAAEDTSFARGLRLLLTVADRGEVRADELSELLEMPLSTVYRYLRTLGEFGFVDRQGGHFRLGPKLLIGTGANVSAERLIRHADPMLRMLVTETGETAAVVRRAGLSSICLHQVESDAALRVTVEPGSMLPLPAALRDAFSSSSHYPRSSTRSSPRARRGRRRPTRTTRHFERASARWS